MAFLYLPSNAQSVDVLITNAEKRLEQDDWVRAVKDFKSILEKHKASLSALQKANVYNDLGYLSMRLLNAEDAEYFLNLSIIGHEEAGLPDKVRYASALQNMSQLFLQRVQYDLAKSYIDQAIEVITNAVGTSSASYALARTKLANIYEEVGYYELAYDIYFASHESLKSLGAFSPDYAEACNHMGRILIRQGEPQRAEEYINESTVIYKQLGKSYDVERAESLEGLGNFYEQLGRYEEAEKTLLEALAIKRSIPNEANILIIETLNDLGILYRHLGDPSRAQEMFAEVVAKCEEELTTDHPFYATAKNNLATIAMQDGDNANAKELLEEALATYDKKYGPNHPLSANTLNNLARVQRQMGNTTVAEDYYKRVLKLDERLYGKNHPDYATTLMNLAILYSSSGRDEEADGYYAEALAIRKDVLGKDHPSYFRALENVGLHSISVGKMEEAEKYFREAIEIQIRQTKTIFPALPQEDKEYFYQNIRQDVDRYNFIASGLLEEQPELVKNMFDFQNQTKSILFTPSEKIQNRIINGSDQTLRADFFDWQEQKLLLANYYRIGQSRLLENNISLSDIEAEIRSKESSITSRMSEFDQILQNSNKKWHEIQGVISEDQAIVEIIKIREFKSQTNEDGMIFGFTNLSKYVAIVFSSNSPEGPSHVFLGDGYNTDQNRLNQYKNGLAVGDTQDTFKSLWSPIHQMIGKSTEIMISPDGIFHSINPNVLNTSGNKFVIDDYFVSQLTSCNDLFRENEETLTKKISLFGNPNFKGKAINDLLRLKPLPSGNLEVQAISSILEPKGWNSKIFAGNDASELRLRSAYNPTILHVTSHGFFSEKDFISYVSVVDDPMFKSGFFLTGASEAFNYFAEGVQSNPLNDGLLTTYEAMNLDLNRTKLVALSIPQAGTGSEENREGMYGLQRAFMVAGAENIVANFSRIDPAASTELMVLFYHRYLETENVRKSLRFAQTKLRTKYSDPSVWGAFILIGNG